MDSEGDEFKLEAVDFETTLSRKLLDSQSCYVLDCGPGCVFYWLGKAASNEKRAYIDKYAQELQKQPGRPPWMYIYSRPPAQKMCHYLTAV